MPEKPKTKSFLDEFYNLSSKNLTTRSKAAESIVQHCFAENTNEEDKYYTLQRLYKGIASNRLSSKQGFSSCLVSFLGLMKEDHDWLLKKNGESCTLEDCLYDLYSKETTPKKGEQERDYMHSKLFLVNILLKSGILNQDTKKYVNDIIQVYNTKKDYNGTFKEGIISTFILLLESCEGEDVCTLLQEKLLFKNDKNDWDINELALGVYMYRTKSTKALNVFNPCNMHKWKGTLINHTSTNTQHIFWQELSQYKEDLVVKFVLKDILPSTIKNVNFSLYILQTYLPLSSLEVMEDAITKGILLHLCMDLLTNKKRKKQSQEVTNASSIWKDIFTKCSTEQCFALYKLMTKYIPTILNHEIIKDLYNKTSDEQKKEYVVYLQELITTFKVECRPTWMDLLYHLPNSNKELYQDVIQFFMKIAFQTSNAPMEYKKLASSRFYSTITDAIQQILFKKQPLGDQVDAVYGILNKIYESYYKDKELYSDCIHQEYHDKLNDIFEIVDNLQKIKKVDDDGKIVIQACMNLIYFVFLQLFHIASSEDEEDDVLEDLDILISDINHILHQFLDIPLSKEDEEDTNPLTLLADICITILSFYNDKHSSKNKGSSIKLLQRIVKMSFKSCLKHCSSIKKYNVDMNVMSVILESICIDYFTMKKEDDEMEEDGSDRNEEGSEDSDDSSIEDENVFSTAAGIQDLDLENMDVDDDSIASSNQEDEGEIMLDSNNLQDHLLNSDSEEEMVLEHDEKADPALVKLIKLKQQQRKKAIQEKQSIQLSHQLRCIPIAELCLSSEMITQDVVYMSIITFLVQRRLVEKQIFKEKNENNNNVKEKQLLLDKIDHLLIDLLCKIKLSSCKSSDITNDIYVDILHSIIQEADSSNLPSNSQHSKYCSICFLYIVKYVWGDVDGNLEKEIMKICNELVTNWYTVRNTNIHTSFFTQFASRNLCLARIVFTPFIIHSTTKARSSYIKSEAFQLLSTFYTTKKQDDSDSFHAQSTKVLESNISGLALSLQSTYKDDEMLKAKRLNDVLKANSMLIQFVADRNVSVSFWNIMETLISLLQDIQLQSTSTSIKTKCGNLVQSIQEGLDSRKKMDGGDKKKEKKKAKKSMGVEESKKTCTDDSNKKDKSKDDGHLVKEKKKDESRKEKKKSKRRITK